MTANASEDASDRLPAHARAVTAGLVVIGDEILSGRTQDSNLAHLGGRLNDLGVRLAEARVIGDDRAAIVEAVNALRARHQYVFTTGGIGPTHDDVTAAAVAEAVDRPLTEQPEARAILERRYGPEGLTAARLRMAQMPEGAQLIDNPVSRVPGFRIGNLYVLAGIPEVMQAMLETVAPELVGGAPVLTATVVAALPEGELAGPLGELQARYPELSVGSYPFFGKDRYGASLVLRGPDRARLAAAKAELMQLVRDLGAEPEPAPDDLDPDGSAGPRHGGER
jgi:molybdenum cofactor synthesis domain-containing protein